MKSFFCFIFVISLFHGYWCLDLTQCNGTYRQPAYTDISVNCGPQNIDLAIYLCPIYFAGYNESLLFLNNILTNPACGGRVDLTGPAPFLRFTFSINDSTICGSLFQINNTVGDGVFKDFSNIQSVNISGAVRSKDYTLGTVTFNPDLLYLYSCTYQLEYLMNNTRVDVTGSTVAINANNGSFISTLSLRLFVDENYTRPLVIPSTGLYVRTSVCAEVKATNLTDKFNVLLDRCYASVSPYPSNSTYYDLFVGCQKDPQTNIILNGDKQSARFCFKSFRFLEHSGLPISTYFLHCVTRLCEKTSCVNFKPVCARKKRFVREVSAASSSGTISDPATVSSTGIGTSNNNALQASNKDTAMSSVTSQQIINTTVGLGITVGFLALLCIVIGGIAFLMHRRFQRIPYPEKSGFH
ncbi:zona pellucida-like domain-containing protein 1 [Rhinatrema bivittatum]|uniref:zona pellucida-like domain-containing protein 1 n=1 Tax=Rhinatrema bivittatum TaxID=194408 RepID=UPI001127B579|nr:zona pellucida-like domain-containing protein 1 [Rhinatrema bivittatum]